MSLVARLVNPALLLTLASACGAGPSGGDSATSEDTSTGAGTSTSGGSSAASSSTSTTASESSGDTSDTGDASTGDASTGDASTGDVSSTTAAASTSDTDGTTGEPEQCAAPATPVPCDQGSDDMFKAIGVGCSDDADDAVPIEKPTTKVKDSSSYQVATRYGSAQDPIDPALPAWGPREGERFLVIGTGKFPLIKQDGVLIEADGEDSQANDNVDDLQQLPGVMKVEPGSNNGMGGTPFLDCDGLHDCSDTLMAQWDLKPNNVASDVFYLAFDVRAPAGTHGYQLDFVFFSEEWPFYVDTDYNDMFVIWSTSESFTGNITFLDGMPLTATSLDPWMTFQPGDPALAGTGFPGDDEGAATGWITARGSAQPGEKFTIAISIFDMGDTLWDSVALVDNFRWDCDGCVPGQTCGLSLQ